MVPSMTERVVQDWFMNANSKSRTRVGHTVMAVPWVNIVAHIQPSNTLGSLLLDFGQVDWQIHGATAP
jgi:hypothetical protein